MANPIPGVVGGVSRSEVSVATGETAQGPLADATPIAPALSAALLSADAGQAPRKPKLLVRVRQAIRTRQYSARTEQAYVQWIRCYIESVRRLHENDVHNGLGRAPLPDALKRKYTNADRQWGWQFVFPASSHHVDSRSGTRHRHHLHESVLQKRMAQAVRLAGLVKPATPHTLRHSFATELIRDGYDIRTVNCSATRT